MAKRPSKAKTPETTEGVATAAAPTVPPQAPVQETTERDLGVERTVMGVKMFVKG